MSVSLAVRVKSSVLNAIYRPSYSAENALYVYYKSLSSGDVKTTGIKFEFNASSGGSALSLKPAYVDIPIEDKQLVDTLYLYYAADNTLAETLTLVGAEQKDFSSELGIYRINSFSISI